MKYPGFLDAMFTETRGYSQLRSILFDGVTGLPILPLVLESLKDIANRQHKIGIVFIDTTRLEALEESHGWELVDRLLNQIRNHLDSIGARFGPLQMLAVHRMSGDDFLLFFSAKDPSQPVSSETIGAVASELQRGLNEFMALLLEPSLLPFGRIFVGHSLLHYNSNVRFERLVARAVSEAYQSAITQEARAHQNQVRQLQDLVSANQIRILFQPIIDLRDTQQILGYEALSRGPEGSLFESAEFMFTLASHSGLLNSLEDLCQKRLIDVLQKNADSTLVFVNLEPTMLENQQYRALALFQKEAVQPDRVVLEITERIAINDYNHAARELESIRDMGYRIAIDDVGSGYASLASIAYLKPDYIKVNEKMVNGIADDFIKQEIVKTLRDLGSRFSASLIAEGIEEQKDLQTLQDLHVQYGQGYFFQRPAELL